MRKRSMFHRSIFRADPNGDPDINTTPLIDVMLVMLVMFIITIPPPTHSVDVTLPVGAIEPGKILDENRVTIDTSDRSEEHTSELQSLMRISYAVFCLKKKNKTKDEIIERKSLYNNDNDKTIQQITTE